MEEIAKVLGKREPHLIHIKLSGGEPYKFSYEREEIHFGKPIKVVYTGEFHSRQEL